MLLDPAMVTCVLTDEAAVADTSDESGNLTPKELQKWLEKDWTTWRKLRNFAPRKQPGS